VGSVGEEKREARREKRSSQSGTPDVAVPIRRGVACSVSFAIGKASTGEIERVVTRGIVLVHSGNAGGQCLPD
jgi:hypothetical protein